MGADKDTVRVVMTSVSTQAIALLGHRDVSAGPISGPQHPISALQWQHYLSHDNDANGAHTVGKWYANGTGHVIPVSKMPSRKAD